MGSMRSLWLLVILALLVVGASGRRIPKNEDPSPSHQRSLTLGRFAQFWRDKERTGDKISKRDETDDDPFDPEDSLVKEPGLHHNRSGLLELIKETVSHFQLHLPHSAVIVIPISMVAMSILCCLTFVFD